MRNMDVSRQQNESSSHSLLGRVRKWMKFASTIQEGKSAALDDDWMAAGEDPPSWDQFPGAQCVSRWATELRDAIAGDADSAVWRLVGVGAAVEYKDVDLSESLLRRVAHDAGLRFVAIPEDVVLSISLNASCPFQAMAPVMVYLEPGDWMRKIDVEKQGQALADSVRDFRQTLKSFMKGFNPRHPVIFTTAADDLDDIVPMLRASGLFDRRFIVRPPTPLETGLNFIKQLGLDICSPSLVDAPHKVGVVVQDYPNMRMQELHLLHLQRKAARENRRLEFIDLVEASVLGSVENDELPPRSDDFLRLVAVHEAGHAVVAMVDSTGSNIPEYLSIIEHLGCNGVSVDSCTYRDSVRELRTYADFRHQIRGYLAGRAAEEVVFGTENVSGGSREDLVHAHVLAFDGFAVLGFAPNMNCARASASNLLVTVAADDPSDAEEAHVHVLTRQFLADQYLEVLALVATHRRFLDQIAERLLQHKAMDQGMLSELLNNYLQSSGLRLSDRLSDNAQRSGAIPLS